MQAATIDRSKEWILDDYLMLGEMNTPCQLINGESIMSPSPTPHYQIISNNLNDILKSEATKEDGMVFFAPIDLCIDNKNVFQPDLIYISRENKNIITHRAIEGVPDLVVEIVSPSSIFSYRYTKKKVYQKIGVKEYWIVDPANRTLEIYLSSQGDPNAPHLYAVEEGRVTSTVLLSLDFNLKSIF